MRHLLWVMAGCGSLHYYPDSFEPGETDTPGSTPGDDDEEPEEACEEPCDADGDGEPAADGGGKDCDDEDPDIYPGAPEACDGLDNDCDEIVDDDADGDGVGVCEDCDDEDNERFPGALEDCDGLDSDCDELDCLQWEEDFESGVLGAPWILGGAEPWFATTLPQQGQWSAKSGNVRHSERSSMEVELDFPSGGSVTFWFSVSSEVNFDYLHFLVDGLDQGAWSGVLDWQSVTYDLDPGSHTLEWRYIKDGSVTAGEDGALVDAVSVVGGVL
jgi:hypothetical protein